MFYFYNAMKKMADEALGEATYNLMVSMINDSIARNNAIKSNSKAIKKPKSKA
jgi:hypothetical protein